MTLTSLRYIPWIPRSLLWGALLVGFPLLLAAFVLGLNERDLSIPMIYGHGDDLWQLILTKVVNDTGWVLTNPYLGAPAIAHWHHNAAAQTSALHSLLMLALSHGIDDSVRLQQVYYLLNFPLICVTSFVACRLLGISRLPAFCVGLLFAFTSFRIQSMHYAFLSNYFTVPLALVAVIWTLTGRFTASVIEGQDSQGARLQRLARLFRSRDFALGLAFVVLIAVSDGYYAFFTLLLLGFALFCRVLVGDWRRPLVLVPAGIYIASLLAVSLSLQLPPHNYKKAHWNEFYPNGIQDGSLVKHPFEAEVYSSSLKLMIAPIPDHRIEPLARVGRWMVETSDGARLFKTSRVPLGTLGSLLFLTALALLALPTLRREVVRQKALGSPWRESPEHQLVGDALLSLTLFIFLCSIVGGLGTLVALVFPTIRAYDRFSLFLIFVLYLGAAWVLTVKLKNANVRSRALLTGLTVLITAAALYDQIPRDAAKGSESTKAKFLAERRFVKKVEEALPSNAMVYQYPYSQYLRESRHYGWGSFSHVRLYLHSRQLHWSNGGAKNSPADDWNFRISQLPVNDLITEVEAVGFSGFVIDRTVLSAAEYESVHRPFAARRYEMIEDPASNLTFVKLHDPGFRLVYDSAYRAVDRIVVTDPVRLAGSGFPGAIKGEALKRFIEGQANEFTGAIRRGDHPEIFIDSESVMRGMGNAPILPISEMLGRMTCRVDPAIDAVLLTLHNRSSFDWRLGAGAYPIGVGVHLRAGDGELLRWDDGFRIPSDAYVKQGSSSLMRVPLCALPRAAEIRDGAPVVAEFALVQDGNAWFGDVSCSAPLR